MTDTITLRDHSQPCEHVEWAYQYADNETWGCDWFADDSPVCPGGKEITLRQCPITYDYRTEGPGSYIEVGND